MIVRELIELLEEQPGEAVVRLEVGGDGAVHESYKIEVVSRPWETNSIVLTGEGI